MRHFITCNHLLLIFFNCLRVCNSRRTDFRPDDDEDVVISPQCAAILIAIGGTAAAGAFTMTPNVLCTAGFCSTGIAGGSFASWWQSTMPLVAKGSLFSYLQSIAMGGAGSMTALQSIIGLGAITYVMPFCTYIDEIDPDSTVGKSIATTHYAVTTLGTFGETVHSQCASSETCSVGMETATSVAAAVLNTASDLKKSAEEQLANSEAYVTGKAKASEMMNSAARSASAFWAAAKEGASVMTTRFGELMDELEEENNKKKRIG